MPIPFIAAAVGLAQFAPIIGKWIGGKGAEDMAQKVVNLANSVTDSLDPVTAMQKLSENNKMLLDFQRAILDMEVRMIEIELQDRQDARARDVAMVKSGQRNVRADVMVVSAAIGLGLCLASLGYYSNELPGEAVGIISMIAGIFGACLKDAYAFEFGSSRGSKEKDSTVAALLDR
ncbi:MAG: hypothetical protein K2X98_05785 [Alphaproteobacteria bacterium]|nr:hypothetical protein [Alphaproteobacteria bacterium]